ncbi:phage major capsid protein [Pseudomonas aeruginosa]|uniref:phage major capsid protein n=1 Tax=Pseudomonas aeruginosa TaxID=287 RepID=UPI0023585EFE|nr:phage major capsid protein [Pseudomonas aeruginosa]
MSDFEKQIGELNASLKQVGDQIKSQAEQVNTQIANFGEMNKETRAKVDELLTAQGELQARLSAAEQAMLANEKRDSGEEAPKTAGQMVAESLKEQGVTSSLRGSHRVSMPRSAITSIDSSGGALVAPDRRPGVVAAPQRRLTIRDLVAPGTTESNSVEYVRETGFVNNAAPVSEGTQKPYSDLFFELENAPVRTIAHLFKASRQILDDASALQSYIDARARYGLMLVEEGQLLYGNGTGANLHGIIPQAQAYAPPSGVVVTAEQRIDRIRLAILQAQLAEVPASGIVHNPNDWALIELTKDAENRYIIGSPQNGTTPTLWRLPVVETQAITQDEFLTGAFSLGAQIFDRMDIEVLVSTENDKDFENNMVTIRAEERLAFAVYRPEAFVVGSLTSS